MRLSRCALPGRLLRTGGVDGSLCRPIEAQGRLATACLFKDSSLAGPTAADREPPPLPYHLKTSGVGWLVAALVLVALTIVVFARGLKGPAVTATIIDDAVVGWLAGLGAPGLVRPWSALAALSSWWVLNSVAYGLLLALLALRRLRHLIIWVIVANLVPLVAASMVGPFLQRPRPLGWSSRPAGGAGPCRHRRSHSLPPGW
jgi:hypothetical protein